MKIVRRHLALVVASAATAAIAWAVSSPAAQGLPDPVAHGKTIYESRCAECHGASGRGDGSAGPHLTPAPRDFTSAKYKIRSTETGSIPTDSDLAQSIKQGLGGSPMPGWGGILSDADIRDVVEYIKSLSPRFAAETPKVVATPPPVASSPESVGRGQKAYDKLQCGKCHGTDGRGTGAVTTEFQDDWKQPLRSTDLTEPWTFHGGSTARDVFLRFRTGHVGHAHALVRRRRQRCRDVGPRQLRGVARRNTAVVDERGRGPAFYAQLDAEREGQSRQARRLSRRDAWLLPLPLARRREPPHAARDARSPEACSCTSSRSATIRPATSRLTKRPASGTGLTTRSSRSSRAACCLTAPPSAVPDGLGVVLDDEGRRI